MGAPEVEENIKRWGEIRELRYLTIVANMEVIFTCRKLVNINLGR